MEESIDTVSTLYFCRACAAALDLAFVLLAALNTTQRKSRISRRFSIWGLQSIELPWQKPTFPSENIPVLR
jgi:hypothetical protein